MKAGNQVKPSRVETFRIRSYEMDASGRASVQTICNYLQELAGVHAAELGVSVQKLFEQNLTWVLSRLHVQIDKYPRWGEQITVKTWPSGAMGLYATREFILTDEKQNQLGRATTSWMILDLIKKRPIGIPDHIDRNLIADKTRAIDDSFDRLPVPDGIDNEIAFNVRRSDLDINQHVNNVNYIEWAIESVPPEYYSQNQLKSVEISFRAESKYGDRILSQCQATDGLCIHRLIRESDKKDVAIVRTHWQQKIR